MEEGTSLANGMFTIQRRLERGPSGELFLAQDRTNDALVVLKLLPESLVRDTDAFFSRFKREFHRYQTLRHERISTLHGHVFDRERQRHFLVRLHAPGVTLEQYRLARPGGRILWSDVVEIGRKIAAILDQAHALDLSHRALKPQNVILDQDGEIRLVDFGMAHAVRDLVHRLGGDLDITALEKSHPYIAPEQFLLEHVHGESSPRAALYIQKNGVRLVGSEPGPGADIFALGVLLYELATGRVPFTPAQIVSLATAHGNSSLAGPGLLAALTEAQIRIGNGTTPGFGTLPPLNEARIRVFARALHWQPGQRFARAGEFMDAFAVVAPTRVQVDLSVPADLSSPANSGMPSASAAVELPVAAQNASVSLPDGQATAPIPTISLANGGTTAPAPIVALSNGGTPVPAPAVALPKGGAAMPAPSIALPNGGATIPAPSVALPDDRVAAASGGDQAVAQTPSVNSLNGGTMARASAVASSSGRTMAQISSVQVPNGGTTAQAPSVQAANGGTTAQAPSVQAANGGTTAQAPSVQAANGGTTAQAPSVQAANGGVVATRTPAHNQVASSRTTSAAAHKANGPESQPARPETLRSSLPFVPPPPLVVEQDLQSERRPRSTRAGLSRLMTHLSVTLLVAGGVVGASVLGWAVYTDETKNRSRQQAIAQGEEMLASPPALTAGQRAPLPEDARPGMVVAAVATVPEDPGKVIALLAAADRDLESLRLLASSGDQAIGRYQEVMRLDPGNTAARQGVGQVAEKYAQVAQTAIGYLSRMAVEGAVRGTPLREADGVAVAALRSELDAKTREAEQEHRRAELLEKQLQEVKGQMARLVALEEKLQAWEADKRRITELEKQVAAAQEQEVRMRDLETRLASAQAALERVNELEKRLRETQEQSRKMLMANARLPAAVPTVAKAATTPATVMDVSSSSPTSLAAVAPPSARAGGAKPAASLPASAAVAFPPARPLPTPAATASVEEGAFIVQLAAHRTAEKALEMEEVLHQKVGRDAGMAFSRQAAEVGGATWYRVRTGPFASREVAEQALQDIKQRTGISGLVLRQGRW
ncbi:MAG: SPOR domain-containing protein [Magnetococcales bacterium]|nr:SPOR domain-containing protein [Magnetococcales bacterium]